MDTAQRAYISIDAGQARISVHTCDYCKHITLDLSSANALHHDQTIVLAASRRAERAAAKSGCLIFRFTTYNAYTLYEDEDEAEGSIVGAAEEFDDEPQYRGFKLVLRFRKGWHAAPIGAITSYWTSNADNSWDPNARSMPQPRTQYAVVPAEDDEVASVVKRRLPQPDVSSLSSLKTMKNWIHNCDTTHGCYDSEAWNPTRLIAISCEDGNFSAQVRRTAGENKIKYAVLSYAWGTTGSLHRYLEKHSARIEQDGSIPLEDLPQTVLDAVKMTYALGIQYLWVDCLCILQSDVQDRIREIGSMAKIFESAYIGLLAASSRSSDKGFLQLRELDQDMQRCTLVHVRLPDDKSSCARLFTPEYSYAPRQEPLSRRAWTLQESLLTKRKLIFNSRTVTWSCQALARDENWDLWQEDKTIGQGCAASGQTGVSAAVDSGFYEHTLSSMISKRPGTTLDAAALRDLWEAIVTEYTNRDLLEIQDRPLAVSGIVERLHDITRDTYLAGLWRSQLPQALFWIPHPSEASTSKWYERARLPGPTWSWFTVDARCRAVFHTTYLDKVETLVEVLDSDVVLLSNDIPFGAVKSGKITVSGYIEEMYCIVLLVLKKGYRWYDLDGHARDVEFHSDFLISDIRDVKQGVVIPVPFEGDIQADGVTVADASDDEVQYDGSASPISPEHSASEDRQLARTYGIKVSLLYLFECSSNNGKQSFCDGLVVLPTETGEYRRIGIFSNRFVPTVDEDPYQPVETLGVRKVVLV